LVSEDSSQKISRHLHHAREVFRPDGKMIVKFTEGEGKVPQEKAVGSGQMA
jgi:hypothetical protein